METTGEEEEVTGSPSGEVLTGAGRSPGVDPREEEVSGVGLLEVGSASHSEVEVAAEGVAGSMAGAVLGEAASAAARLPCAGDRPHGQT